MRPLEHVHLRVFRLLCRALPSWFRERHGEEMEELFRHRFGRAIGGRARARLWWSTVIDVSGTAAALRRGASGASGGHMDTIRTDVKNAARQLLRAPGFALGAILLLGIGIGANLAVFTLVNALILRPPPFEEPARVVYVYQDSDDGVPTSSSFPAYRDMSRSPAFTAVAATSQATVAWERPDGPTEAAIEFTTAGYLDVLGLRPLRGRWFLAEEDIVGNAPAAVVSAAAWRARLGADPHVVGSTIRLNGQPVTIVGIGPEVLSGSYPPVVTDFWLSISATPVGGSFRVANLDRRQDHWYDVRARLADGVTVAQAQGAMDRLASSLAEQFPDLNRGRDITVFRSTDVRFHPSEDGRLYASGGLLVAIVLTLLLIACANLANLLLARGIGRGGEMAVRRALGAGSGSIARLHLAEGLLLSVSGGVLGVAFARWALGALQSLPLPYPLSATLDMPIDWRIVVFTIVLVVLTGLLAGLAPAVRSARQDVALVLRDDRRSSPTGRGTVQLRNGLVALQVGASLVLVLIAGLLARSLAALQHVDTGVDAEHVAWVRTSLGQAGVRPDEAVTVLEELRDRLSALPGVTSMAVATRLPAQGAGSTTTIVDGYTPPTGTGAVELEYSIVSAGYFETLGLALREGRGFLPTDAQDAERVVLVNAAAARVFWGDVDPVGRKLRSQAQPDVVRTVVGVVENAPVDGLGEPVRPLFYIPITQSGFATGYLLVRTEMDAVTVLRPMRDAVRAVRSTLPVLSQGTLASHFDDALAGARFAARMMGAISVLAMLLAGLGTYAVVSFGVARRSGEMGIRMALGAGQGRVVRMVLRETLGTVVVGLVLGLALAVLAAPRLSSALFGVAPLDPVAFAMAIGLLTGVAGVAAYLPARRAARADPARSLRGA